MEIRSARLGQIRHEMPDRQERKSRPLRECSKFLCFLRAPGTRPCFIYGTVNGT